MSLTCIVLAVEETEASDPKSCIIANVTLEGMDIISGDNKEKIIDRLTKRKHREKRKRDWKNLKEQKKSTCDYFRSLCI